MDSCESGHVLGIVFGQIMTEAQVEQLIVNQSVKEIEERLCSFDGRSGSENMSCVMSLAGGLYLNAGGQRGGAVSKFRFLKHSQVPNCALELRQVSADGSLPALLEGESPNSFLVLCVVSLRRIAPGSPLTVDFSQRNANALLRIIVQNFLLYLLLLNLLYF
jgi:hypothetical protein